MIQQLASVRVMMATLGLLVINFVRGIMLQQNRTAMAMDSATTMRVSVTWVGSELPVICVAALGIVQGMGLVSL